MGQLLLTTIFSPLLYTGDEGKCRADVGQKAARFFVATDEGRQQKNGVFLVAFCTPFVSSGGDTK